jgi:glucokinase
LRGKIGIKTNKIKIFKKSAFVKKNISSKGKNLNILGNVPIHIFQNLQGGR